MFIVVYCFFLFLMLLFAWFVFVFLVVTGILGKDI